MSWPSHKLAFVIASAVLLLWLMGMAISLRAARLAPEASGTMLVVFSPSMNEKRIMASLIQAGALPIRKTWLDFVWLAHGPEAGLAYRLSQQGALASYRDLPISPDLSGCFAYADAKMEEIFSFK